MKPYIFILLLVFSLPAHATQEPSLSFSVSTLLAFLGGIFFIAGLLDKIIFADLFLEKCHVYRYQALIVSGVGLFLFAYLLRLFFP